MKLSDLLLLSTTMTADKREMTERITRIARPRRTVRAALIAALALTAVVCAATSTGAAAREAEAAPPVESTQEPDAAEPLRVGDYLVYERYGGPHGADYRVADAATGETVREFTGGSLIWEGGDLTTAVYSFWNTVYDFGGNALFTTEAGEILRLSFSDEGLIVADFGDGEPREYYQRDGQLIYTAADVYFDDVMGLAGWYTELWRGSFYTRRYYSGGVQIAESWGWDADVFGDADYSTDLDGDGVKELVCNVTYNADGVSGVVVYRRSQREIQAGYLPGDRSALPDCDPRAGATAFGQRYDPETGMFTIEYPTRSGGRSSAAFSADDLAFYDYKVLDEANHTTGENTR